MEVSLEKQYPMCKMNNGLRYVHIRPQLSLGVKYYTTFRTGQYACMQQQQQQVEKQTKHAKWIQKLYPCIS